MEKISEMKSLVDLKDQKLKSSSQSQDLTSQESQVFIKELVYLASAKNIELKAGTSKSWERLLAEDLGKDLFSLDIFIKAMGVVARRHVYNRIDYADVYKEAIDISYKSKAKFKMVCPICADEVLRISSSPDDLIFANCDSYELAERPEIIARRKAIYLIARENKALFE